MGPKAEDGIARFLSGTTNASVQSEGKVQLRKEVLNSATKYSSMTGIDSVMTLCGIPSTPIVCEEK